MEGEINFGYVNSYTNDAKVNTDLFSIDGDMEATGFSTKLAYGIPMNENGWIKGGFGLGFAERRVSFDYYKTLNTNLVILLRKLFLLMSFCWQWHMNWESDGMLSSLIDFSIWQNSDLQMMYRFISL